MRLKKFFIATLSLAMLFALCACQPAEEPSRHVTNQKTVEDAAAEEQADAYLQAHGYPAEFIATAGLASKGMLAEMGAIYEESAGNLGNSSAQGAGLWQGFGSALTVSDASVRSEGLSVKVITYQWQWASERPAEGDSLFFAWSSGYSLLPECVLFELHGTGSLQQETSSLGDEAFPQQAEGSFVVQSAMAGSEYYTDDMLFTIQGGTTLAYDLVVDAGSMFRSVQPSDTYADYRIDIGDYSGSFSIVLVQQCEDDFANIGVTYRQANVAAGMQSVCSFYAYPRG